MHRWPGPPKECRRKESGFGGRQDRGKPASQRLQVLNGCTEVFVRCHLISVPGNFEAPRECGERRALLEKIHRRTIARRRGLTPLSVALCQHSQILSWRAGAFELQRTQIP